MWLELEMVYRDGVVLRRAIAKRGLQGEVMKVAVLDDYQNVFRTLKCFSRLAGLDVQIFHDTPKDQAAFIDRLKDFDAVLLTQQRTSMPRAIIEKLPKLRLISQTGRNVAHLDLAACTEHGVAIASKAGGGDPSSTAELTWGLILSALRHIPTEVEQLKAGRWQTTIGTGLKGKTLGIYAFGKIGSVVAVVGKAFGMRVICGGRDASLTRAGEAGFEVAASREEFFQTSDVVCLHIPLNAETRGIIKAEDLALMKPTALLVNTSRAPLIQEGALVAALKAGRPGMAAVDIYESEPVLGGNHPLLKMDNVVCTPHLGYVERNSYEGLFSLAIDQIVDFAHGKPSNILNPEALGRRA